MPAAVAVNTNASGSEDASLLGVTVTATDSGAGSMEFLLSDLPTHGTLYTAAPGLGVPVQANTYYSGSFDAGNGVWKLSFVFVPDPDWAGATSFHFSATDGNGRDTNTASAAIAIIPVADPPLVDPNVFEAPSPAGPAVQVTPSTLADGPAVADLGGGQTLVVWQEGLGPSNIKAQIYDASGSVGAAFDVTPAGDANELQPKVASTAEGSFAVTWVEDDAGTGGGDIHTAFFAAGSTTPSVVRTTAASAGGREADPMITAAGSGYVVAWSVEASGTETVIMAQRYESNGFPNGAAFTVATGASHGFGTGTSFDPPAHDVAAVGSDGSFVVVSNQNGVIAADLFDPLDTASHIVVDAGTNGRDPVVTGLAGGGFVVVWNYDDGGPTEDIYARVYDAAGAPVTGQLQLTSDSPLQFTPDVAALADGRFVVTWTANNGTDGTYDIFTQTFSATGVPMQGDPLVTRATGAPIYEGQPSITSHDDGTFTIAWHNPGLWVRSFDSGLDAVRGNAGSPIDLPATVSLTDSDGSEHLASVTIGNVPVGWSFNAGAPGGGNSWVIDRSTPAEATFLDGLAAGTAHLVVTPPFDFSGPLTLQIEAVSEDPGGAPLNATSSSAVLPLLINGNPDVDLNGSDPGTSTNVVFVENNPIMQLGADALVTDDNVDFDQGILTVAFGSGGQVDDLLRIADIGGISVDEVQVYFGSDIIGYVSGGTDPTTPLVVSLTAAATPGAVQALVRAIGFVNFSDDPVSGRRVVEITLTDGDGGASLPVTATIDVLAVEDAPLAVDDQIYASEDLVQTGSVFADNGFGNDSDPDGPALVVSAVNGSAANVGQPIVLASGAIVKLDADGAFSFDPHGAYESLGEFETAQEQFTYTLAGGNSATVNVTVNGANDAPVFSIVAGDSGGTAQTESNSGLNASGTLSVVDPEPGDSVAISLAGVVASGTTAGLGMSSAALLAMFGVAPTVGRIDADAGSAHNVAWAFNSGGQAFDYLDDGETLTLAYSVRATDESGAQTDQIVSIVIAGSNDAPTLVAVAGDTVSAILTETNSALTASGTLTATDVDLSDSVTPSVLSVVASGTTADLSSSNAALEAMLGLPANVAADPGTLHNLAWAFDSGAQAFDYLGAGQSVTLDYVVRVTDDSGATADRPISITIQGTNDAPVIGQISLPLGAVSELADHAPGENVATLTDSGTIHFTDPDLPDNAHSAAFAPVAGSYLGTFSLGAVDQANDNVGWSFSVSDAALNALAQGQVIRQYYNVTIDDGHGGASSRVVEIDLIGTNDAAILSSANVFAEQGAVPVTRSGLLTITDEDNPALFMTQSGSAGRWGHFSVDANGNWSYTADQVFALSAGQFRSDVFTILAVDGTPTTVAVTITGHDTPAVARQDLFSTTESLPIGPGLNLFADNGAGADSDPDSPLQVAAVNGVAGNVGHSLLLPSGARVIVNADGTFRYDPNHAFDWLTAAVGAANQFGYDSFTYTLAGGSTEMVFVNIAGQESPGDRILGNVLDNVITGLSGNDTFLLQQGGHDAAWGLTGNDGFYFGATLDSGDSVDGGDGTDTLALQGNTDVDLGTIANVEVILAMSGADARFGDTANNRYDYDLTTNDSNVAAGQVLTVQAAGLLPGEDLHFDGSAETDGAFRIFAGQGVDSLIGGAGNDGFFFGADGNLTGADHVDGGAGVDTLALRGNHVGGNAVMFTNASLSGIEVLALLSGHSNDYSGQIVDAGFDYDVTVADANVAAGALLDVNAARLGADEQLRFDGRAETNGFFRILSGAGDDMLFGGAGNDLLYGGLGKDALEGGAGADTYLYRSAGESTSTGYDTITGFDWHFDRIDAPGGVRGLSDAATGALSTATFDDDLAAGLAGVLGAGQAALFTGNGGDLAGHVFAVIDANGIAGYQAGQDLVIELVNAVLPIDPTAGIIV
jgi:VCBS repeat-containing protein